jgi:hypothetical protein
VDVLWDGNIAFRRKSDRRRTDIPVRLANERRQPYRSARPAVPATIHIETELVAESDVRDVLQGWFPEPEKRRAEEIPVRGYSAFQQVATRARTMVWPTSAVMVALAVGFGGGYFVGHRSHQLRSTVIVPATASAVEVPAAVASDQLSSARASSPRQPVTDTRKNDAATTKRQPTNPAAIGRRATPVIARTVLDNEGNRATSRLGSANSSAASKFVGTVSVDSYPRGADVFIDGKLIGTTPIAAMQVPSGAHVLRLERDGYHRWSSLLRVVTGERNRVSAWLRQ